MLGNSGVCHMEPDYKVSVPVSGFVVTVIGRIGLPVDVFAQSSSEGIHCSNPRNDLIPEKKYLLISYFLGLEYLVFGKRCSIMG